MTHQLPNVDPVDAVISCAVLCHTSDPIFHLATLGKISRKALLV
jgi:hypothetical protein